MLSTQNASSCPGLPESIAIPMVQSQRHLGSLLKFQVRGAKEVVKFLFTGQGEICGRQVVVGDGSCIFATEAHGGHTIGNPIVDIHWELNRPKLRSALSSGSSQSMVELLSHGGCPDRYGERVTAPCQVHQPLLHLSNGRDLSLFLGSSFVFASHCLGDGLKCLGCLIQLQRFGVGVGTNMSRPTRRCE